MMWALRRTARHLRLPRGNGKGASRASANLLERSKCNAVEESNRVNGEGFAKEGHIIARRISHGAYYALVQVGYGFNFTSLAGEKEEDNKIEGKDDDSMSSELDVAPEEDTLASQSQVAEEATASESEVSEAEEAQAYSYLSEAEDKDNAVKLAELVMGCDHRSVSARLDTWIQEGNTLTRKDLRITIRLLRKRQMHRRALQVCQSFLAKGPFQFYQNEYSICLRLVARVHGIDKAQEYFETIPLKMRGKRLYRILVLHCAFMGNIEKIEVILRKMKDAGFSPDVTVYNNLLLKHSNREKFLSILEMMEHENVKPNLSTYKILIDRKGRAGDIVGMEQIVNKMKEDGIKTDFIILSILAKHYAHVGNMQKVESLIEELENNYMNERRALRFLLTLYAVVGKDNGIEKVWNIFESSQTINTSEHIAGIRAWGKLGNIEKAEIIFEKLLSSGKKISSRRVCNALLDVYANHNFSIKGVELVKQMLSKGIIVNPASCDSLVKLFVKSGDIEKAGSFLIEVCRRKRVKPHYRSFSMVLEKYAERGDIANAEKIFDGLTSIGYNNQLQSYEFLLQAYIKAQIPAYGFKERMLAAKLYPSRRIDHLLQKVEALKEDGFKNHISDILD